ncbi:MAG: hypothetical protein IPM84_21445 [Anaerolineae bacterium]|nr:hypothetical protein [Anaerolineae bacterium]
MTAQWAAQVKQAEYEAQRAQRQYSQVEPENRLVAGRTGAALGGKATPVTQRRGNGAALA